ncbi:hypothetical protein ACIBF1_30150 [Spirillospora sp. NPDC050679]
MRSATKNTRSRPRHLTAVAALAALATGALAHSAAAAPDRPAHRGPAAAQRASVTWIVEVVNKLPMRQRIWHGENYLYYPGPVDPDSSPPLGQMPTLGEIGWDPGTTGSGGGAKGSGWDFSVPWVGNNGEMKKSIRVEPNNQGDVSYRYWIFQDYWQSNDQVKYSTTNSYTDSKPVPGSSTGAGRKRLILGVTPSMESVG